MVSQRLLITFLVLIPLLIACEEKEQLVIDTGIDCDIQKAACIKKIRGSLVELQITPKPVKSMRKVTFAISLTHCVLKDVDELVLDLTMPGMCMGVNKVVLKKNHKCMFVGQGIIPTCLTPLKQWKAEVEIPTLGKVDYTFEIIDEKFKS